MASQEIRPDPGKYLSILCLDTYMYELPHAMPIILEGEWARFTTVSGSRMWVPRTSIISVQERTP